MGEDTAELNSATHLRAWIQYMTLGKFFFS